MSTFRTHAQTEADIDHNIFRLMEGSVIFSNVVAGISSILCSKPSLTIFYVMRSQATTPTKDLSVLELSPTYVWTSMLQNTELNET